MTTLLKIATEGGPLSPVCNSGREVSHRPVAKPPGLYASDFEMADLPQQRDGNDKTVHAQGGKYMYK